MWFGILQFSDLTFNISIFTWSNVAADSYKFINANSSCSTHINESMKIRAMFKTALFPGVDRTFRNFCFMGNLIRRDFLFLEFLK